MAIDFTKPATTDNYSTGVMPNIQANQTGLAQWLDSTNTTITGTPPTYAKRYNRTSGAIEEYNGASWAPIAVQGLLYSGGNWGLGGSPGAFKLDITGTLRVSGAITATGGVAGALTGNASTATALQTARTINGVSFDGSANITVAAAAGTLTGSALASSVTASSLTSVGTLSALNIDTGGLSATAAVSNVNYTFLSTATGSQGSINLQPGNSGFGAPIIDVQNSVTGATGRALLYVRSNTVYISGVGVAHDFVFKVNGGSDLFRVTAAGLVQDGAGKELGYKGLPAASVTSGAFAASDRGKCVYATAGVTVPNATMAAEDVVTILNTTSSPITITATISTLRQAGTANTGNRTLAGYGIATVVFSSSALAFITGSGLS